jgi:hypothetical protein
MRSPLTSGAEARGVIPLNAALKRRSSTANAEFALERDPIVPRSDSPEHDPIVLNKI